MRVVGGPYHGSLINIVGNTTFTFRAKGMRGYYRAMKGNMVWFEVTG